MLACIRPDSPLPAGISTADAARLRTLPNSGQAYLIRPAGERCLSVAALTETGLYYGVQTVRQLLEAGVKTGEADVRLPLVSITDWPVNTGHPASR